MIAGFSDSIAELLRERLSEQVRNMDRLRAVSERQRQLLQKRDLDRVAEHEVEKQKLLETIQRHDREIDALRKSWEEHKNQFGAEERREIESLLQQLGERVRQVVEVEGDNVTIVRQLRDEVETELRKLMGLRRGTGYPGGSEPSGRFVDTKA